MPQQLPITLKGFEDHDLTVELAGLTTSARLLLDGQPAPAAEQRGAYSLRRKNGKTVTVRLITTFPDPVPKLVVDGAVVRIAPPLPWYAWICSAAPLLFVLGGGFVGGVIGSVAATLNVQLFRAPWKTSRKLLAVAGLTLAAYILCFLLVSMMGPEPMPASLLPTSTPGSRPHAHPAPPR